MMTAIFPVDEVSYADSVGDECIRQTETLLPSAAEIDHGLLLPGDANGDGHFNQLDLRQLLQSQKYGTSEKARWEDGDFNLDGVFDKADIDLALQTDSYLRPYRRVDLHPGDANGDMHFNEADIDLVLQHGKYLSEQPTTWEQGDWTGDGVFDQLDIVAALQTGNYL